MADAPDQLLLTVSGKDHPGITARLTGVLAQHGAEILDIDQVVLHGRLTLCLRVSLPPRHGALRDLLIEAKSMGVALELEPLGSTNEEPSGTSWVVTALSPRLHAQGLHALTRCLAEHNVNVEKVARLSEDCLSSIELRVRLNEDVDPQALRRELLALATEGGFDVALQPASLYLRSKRLVVMDMDSTLIQIEVIDELARRAGVVDRVSDITERAMRGELDFDASLKERVALLEGLDAGALTEIAESLPLTEGAERLIRVLRRLGFRTAVLSGGFDVPAEALRSRLGIDYAFANTLEVREGRLTGRLVGPIVNAERKAELLEEIAGREGILLDQVIAVGDGANDLLMLEKAGLGIAFRAKPKLREAADTSISSTGLDGILYLLGINGRELREA